MTEVLPSLGPAGGSKAKISGFATKKKRRKENYEIELNLNFLCTKFLPQNLFSKQFCPYCTISRTFTSSEYDGGWRGYQYGGNNTFLVVLADEFQNSVCLSYVNLTLFYTPGKCEDSKIVWRIDFVAEILCTENSNWVRFRNFLFFFFFL